ncbi:MAG TPA: hypothetical protein VJ201_00205 [Candidatus Babeliales bacterium]|nr:hypothetical protein [Candidatus Babeliales bacterium]
MGNIIMSKKEITQVSIFEQLSRRELTQGDAAKILGMTERHIRRKLGIFKQMGITGLVHKNRGKQSGLMWSLHEETLAIDLLKSKWQ